MPNLMVYIEDQIRKEYQRVYLDVDTPADQLVGKLVQQFGLPRYNFSRQRIEYWIERPDEKKRLGQGIRLPGHITLREFGIVKGNLLQLVSPEGRRVWAFIQQILDKIEKEITDKVSGEFKKKLDEQVWQYVQEKLSEIEKTHANDKRVQVLRQWVNKVDLLGGPTKVFDIIKTAVEVYKQTGSLVKLAIVLTTAIAIVMANNFLPLSSAEPPIASSPPTELATSTPLSPSLTVPVATLTPVPNPTSTPTPISTSTSTSTPMPTPTPSASPTIMPSPVVNLSPVADSQNISIDQDTAANITLIARDEDGYALTFSVVSNPSNGTLSGVLPYVTYTPHHGFSGFDSFTFKVNDGQADSNIAAVNITVTANSPPVANNDFVTTDQDMAIFINVLANDVDPEGSRLTVISVPQETRGGTLTSDGHGTVVYDPHLGFTGQDTFSYTVSDVKGATGTATVFVTVNPVWADLAVSQTDSPDPLAIGDDLTYEIRIINNGPAAATGVMVSDQLPLIALFHSATPSQGGCSQEKGLVTCQIGDMPAATEARIRVAVTMGQGQDQARVVTNIVEVTGHKPDPEHANNTSSEDTTINPPAAADLVVTTLHTTGPAAINTEGRIEVPIRLTVKNQGGTEAGIFKVSTEYTGPNGTFVVAFTVPGQHSIWYPYTNAPLAAGDEVTFAGTVSFRDALGGETISLKATADSCSGDEFMPSYCRVEEGNEENNQSDAISVPLPVVNSGLPDLEVIIATPDSAALVGSDIQINAEVQNWGDGLAPGTGSSGSNGYMVDIVLSSDTIVPPGWAIYSPNYSEDVLLRGGRFSNTADLAPGRVTTYQGGNGLPADTPPGHYYVCARVDPGSVVPESNERNNVSCTPIRIESQPVVEQMKFRWFQWFR